MDAEKSPIGRRYKSIPRDPEQNALLLYQRPAGFLTRKSSRTIAFPTFVSDFHDGALVTYSDEIVQAFHLFPYYPFFGKKNGTGRLFNCGNIVARKKRKCNPFFSETRGGKGRLNNKKRLAEASRFLKIS